jgi:membrane protein
VLAAAVGFRLFLFLVPYIFVFVAGFGIVAEASDRSPSAVARDAGIGGLVAQSISDVAGGSVFERVAALVVGLLATFLAARALYKVLRVSHALVWGVPLSMRASVSRGAMGVIALATLVLLGAAALGGLREASFAVGLLGTLMFAAVVGAVWVLCSWWLPRAATHWSQLVPGAVLIAVGTEILHLVTVYWVAYLISSKSQTYGTIGTALALLVWAYVAGRLVVSAAVLNASRWRAAQRPRRNARSRSDGPSGGR